MSKAFSKIWLLAILIILIAGGIFAWQYRGTPQEKVSGPKAPKGGSEIWIEPEYPEEYLIYQDYLRIIGGIPGDPKDTGTIEATVVSVTKREVCPDETDPFAPEPKKCSIEPYPKDFGVVRIDKIIDYVSYGEQTVEAPPGEEPSEQGKVTPGYEEKTTPGYKGIELPEPKVKLPEYERLQKGQEVPAIFVLTTRPIKVRYVSIPPKEESEEPIGPTPKSKIETEMQSGEVSEQAQTVTPPPGTLEPTPKVYKPIPKDGEYFVFTTKIIEYPEVSQKIFPGLRQGSKFRAKIRYNGTLYIEEYDIISW